MGEFFNGWRRKTGVVTLVMACVLLAGWVRTINRPVFFDLQDNVTLASVTGWLSLSRRRPAPEIKVHSWPLCVENGEYYEDVLWISDWSIPGFRVQEYGTCDDSDGTPESASWTRVKEIGMEYWVLILPCTLLSASLLLTKSRRSTPKKSSEPVNVEGT